MSSISFGGIGTFSAQKLIQEELTKFTKILNYIKSSCIVFWPKMPGYSHYMYYLQKESTHCDLKVLIKFCLKVLGHFGPKKSYKKNQQNAQKFLNYINFHMLQNVLIPPNHILPTRSKIIIRVNQNLTIVKFFNAYCLFNLG